MSLFKYGEFEKELDFSDPDFLDRIEEANSKMKRKAQNIPTTGKQTNIVRKQVEILDAFFDEVLGAGASKEMFDSKSALKRTEAFQALQEAQTVDTRKMDEARNLWSPNREQRRHPYNNKRR